MHGNRRKGEVVEITCVTCAAVFNKLACFMRQHPTTKYCSMTCRDAARKKADSYVDLSCLGCSKIFKRLKTHVGKNTYCSKACPDIGRVKAYSKWRDKEAIKEYMKAHAKRTKKERSALSAKWCAANSEKRKEVQARYRKNNQEKIVTIHQRRWHAKISGDLTPEQWIDIKAQFGKCVCCQRDDVKLTLDHIKPLVMGGLHTENNVQPLCRSCNSKKGAKEIDYRKMMKTQHGIVIRET